tara:strand:+ start:458 stop:1921 length:1464 start_codon:yes stop_codon:yes gene_type:complete
MAQHDYVIDNQSFPATRTDINNVLQAIVSNNSGTSQPTTMFGNQWWVDTTNNKLMLRNEDNDAWIEVAVLDQSNDIVSSITSETLVANIVNERSSGSGVTVDGLLIKDKEIGTSAAPATLQASAINNGQIGGRRNLAFNGAMRISQRGTQTGQTGSVYTACDRFLTSESGAAVTTSTQETDVPSGQGFANSLEIDVTTADASLAASDNFLIIQRLEGQDLQQLLYGTSDAKDLTISFWVKSPKTGTHILELRHNDATYFNSQAYTISSANTWQKVTLTFSGYTTTAFDDDNDHSLSINWWLMAGSNFTSGSLNSNTWHNTPANRAVGQVNCVDDAANNFYLTGVQLEVGSVATEFEHRSTGDELALCQRYYHRQERADSSDSTGLVQRNVAGLYLGISQVTGATTAFIGVMMPITMRATPTIASNDISHISVFDGSNLPLTSLSLVAHKMINLVFLSLGFASGGTANQAARVFINTSGSFVEFDAEL